MSKLCVIILSGHRHRNIFGRRDNAPYSQCFPTPTVCMQPSSAPATRQGHQQATCPCATDSQQCPRPSTYCPASKQPTRSPWPPSCKPTYPRTHHSQPLPFRRPISHTPSPCKHPPPSPPPNSNHASASSNPPAPPPTWRPASVGRPPRSARRCGCPICATCLSELRMTMVVGRAWSKGFCRSC